MTPEQIAELHADPTFQAEYNEWLDSQEASVLRSECQWTEEQISEWLCQADQDEYVCLNRDGWRDAPEVTRPNTFDYLLECFKDCPF